MKIFDIFSKRNREKQQNIFKYNDLPNNFRVQVVYILNDAIGTPRAYPSSSNWKNIWKIIHDCLCREYGVFKLHKEGNDAYDCCIRFLLEEKEVEKVLDIIELSFRVIERVIPKWKYKLEFENIKISLSPEEAIQELNYRFQEHGIGYQYINGQIVRVDSDYIYKEAVEPAVNLLVSEGFEGALEEFMKAHEHFRKGNNKEAINEALKAFESVMKTICKRMNWELSEKQTANPLIKTLIQNNLIPDWLQSSLQSLPTLRNKLTAHGQGEKRIKIPQHQVAYALHLCATNIVFLIESYKEKAK